MAKYASKQLCVWKHYLKPEELQSYKDLIKLLIIRFFDIDCSGRTLYWCITSNDFWFVFFFGFFFWGNVQIFHLNWQVENGKKKSVQNLQLFFFQPVSKWRKKCKDWIQRQRNKLLNFLRNIKLWKKQVKDQKKLQWHASSDIPLHNMKIKFWTKKT